MYLILIIIFLILLSWLLIFTLKSIAKGVNLLFALGAISLLAVGSLMVINYYYERINPLAVILLLIITFALVMFYYVRRLR